MGKKFLTVKSNHLLGFPERSSMSFIKELMEEMNSVPLYSQTDEKTGETFKTIRCDTVCDIISVLLDKYNLEEKIKDDLS